MTKVYEVDYKINKGTEYEDIATMKVIAKSPAEAKRTVKKLTGCLIKDMRIGLVMGI